MPKPEFVRVKNEGGHEVTITAANAKRRGLEVLDKPATDPVGKPLPPKPRVSKGTRRKSPAPVTPTTEPDAPADEKKEG